MDKDKNLGGRPVKFSDSKKMEEILNKYFEETPEDKITLTGIILALDITKETFYQYAQKEGFKEIINKARLRVENSYENDLRDKGRAGDIFALKNFGWKDKTETEISNNGTIAININRNPMLDKKDI